jgi:hypothetical protein
LVIQKQFVSLQEKNGDSIFTDNMNTINNRQIQFVTLAIGATAQRMGITATELHNRLKRHGLVRRLLLDCYDTLHTESIDGVVWNVEQALKNWDEKEGGQQ